MKLIRSPPYKYLDAGGNEVASKVINLPTGTVFPINNAIITYKNLYWPDVIAALKVRDEGLPTATSPSEQMLYELIKAILKVSDIFHKKRVCRSLSPTLWIKQLAILPSCQKPQPSTPAKGTSWL